MNKLENIILVACCALSLDGFTEKEVFKNNDSSYFVMEKIESSNIAQWSDFVQTADSKQTGLSRALNFIKGIVEESELAPELLPALTPIDKIKNPAILNLVKNENSADEKILKLRKVSPIIRDMADGISNFKNGLKNYQGSLGDVWIAYLSSRDPQTILSVEEKQKYIEMAMTVLVKEKSPLSMHMGIFRNPFYFVSDEKQHARTSPMLHAFAAKIAKKYYEDLSYMVTTPLGSMATIFKGVLPNGSFAEGMNEKGTWIIRSENDKDTNYNFTLYDRDITDAEKKQVITINDSNRNQYSWLLYRFHQSLTLHPYFVVKIIDLARLFTGI